MNTLNETSFIRNHRRSTIIRAAWIGAIAGLIIGLYTVDCASAMAAEPAPKRAKPSLCAKSDLTPLPQIDTDRPAGLCKTGKALKAVAVVGAVTVDGVEYAIVVPLKVAE